MAKRSVKKRSDVQQTRREIWGVALLALGIFLGVCLYAQAVGIVGEKITGLLFGLSGLFAYALPVALCAGGVLLIACAAKPPQRGRLVLILVGLLLVLALLQAIKQPMLGTSQYLPYLKNNYLLGQTDHSGGGALGAMLTYPLLLLTGAAGTYIFLSAGILIILLIVTQLSLRKTGQKAVETVKSGIQYASEAHTARQQRLYTQSLREEEDAPPKRTPRRTQAPQPRQDTAPSERPDVAFIPSSGKIRRRPEREAPQDAAQDRREEPPLEEPLEPDDFVTTAVRVPGVSIRPPKFMPPRFDLPATDTPVAPPAHEPARVIEAPFGTRRVDAGETPAMPGIAMEQPPAPPVLSDPPPYAPPSLSLLDPPRTTYGRAVENLEQKGNLLIETLQNFNVSAKLVDICVGPVITRFELQPAPGVRVNRITALADDIALALAARQVRIEAPIPGKAAVGVEIPNKDTAMVVLRDVLESREYSNAKHAITMALGKDIAGKVVVTDMTKMPHLLVAGTTGSGKSKSMNSIILSMVYKYSPQELQFIIIDPKQVEFTIYNKLPHMKTPVVNNPKKAAGALCGAVTEMTERYRKFAQAGARDLARYNALQENEADRLPMLVIVIDELADLMMVAADTVEDSICRIAQLGRASGIHLIVATQRPSADVITGLIKANIPSRIALSVSSAMESRIILDGSGAEKLLGNGDMLFLPNGSGKPLRVQGSFVSDEEIERVMLHFENQALTPTFDESIIEDIEARGSGASGQGNGKQEDELLGDAVRIVIDSGQASISMIQRRLRVGYARAARLVDIMEQHGFVSGFDGSKARKVLITRSQYEQVFGSAVADTAGNPVPAIDDAIPAGTWGGTAAIVKPKPEEPAQAKPKKDLAAYDDDDPDAPWARKPGEPPPWEEVPFEDE